MIAELQGLTTAHLADGCVRAGVVPRYASLKPIAAGPRIAGRVLPARHAGSVDVFFEAIELGEPGDVLVADNGGRADEACVGDLIGLEALRAGLSGIVIWGFHRDTAELREAGIRLWSLGATPCGPLRLDARHPDALQSARIESFSVTGTDVIVADDDGVVALASVDLARVAEAARKIRDTEAEHARLMRAGTSFRDQVGFDEFLERRTENAALTFRQYLRQRSGSIEE